MKENICGIYKIESLTNRKLYIGSAINIKERWRSHKKLLKKDKHYNKHLQNAWNKYGEDNFSFEIIECVEYKNILIEREQYWLDYYNSYDRKIGYNISPTAGSPLGVKHTQELKEKRREISKTKKSILQIDLNGNIITHWKSLKEISKKTEISYSQIADILKNRRGHLCHGFIWIYEKDYSEFDLNKYINNKHQKKKVCQFDYDGNLIKIWDSPSDICKNTQGYVISSLCNVLNYYKERSFKSYKGYVWMYEYDYLENGFKGYTPKRKCL